jgi:hypothetical protein
MSSGLKHQVERPETRTHGICDLLVRVTMTPIYCDSSQKSQAIVSKSTKKTRPELNF